MKIISVILNRRLMPTCQCYTQYYAVINFRSNMLLSNLYQRKLSEWNRKRRRDIDKLSSKACWKLIMFIQMEIFLWADGNLLDVSSLYKLCMNEKHTQYNAAYFWCLFNICCRMWISLSLSLCVFVLCVHVRLIDKIYKYNKRLHRNMNFPSS